MQTNLASIVQERRGHDRVLDAIHIKVHNEGGVKNAAAYVAPDTPTHKVSLSRSGLAFADQVFYEEGSELNVSLFLFPSKEKEDCQIKIISVGDAPEVSNGDWPTYRAVFSELPEDQADLLSQHVDNLLSKMTAVPQ